MRVPDMRVLFCDLLCTMIFFVLFRHYFRVGIPTTPEEVDRATREIREGREEALIGIAVRVV